MLEQRDALVAALRATVEALNPETPDDWRQPLAMSAFAQARAALATLDKTYSHLMTRIDPAKITAW